MSKKDKNVNPEAEVAEEVTETQEATETTAETEAAPEGVMLTKEQFEALQKMSTDLNDKYMRLAAEYDNYRKRTTKEKENIYGDAKADTIKPFLDIYDNLIRGLNQFEESDPHRQGFEMITKQFLDVITKLGVEEIASEGQPFDPEKHNAVMHVDDENVGENTIVDVFQKGFTLGDKVLRFAMVKVAN